MSFRTSLPGLVLGTCLLVTAGVAVPEAPSLPSDASRQALRLWEQLDDRKLKLRSKSALIVDHFGNTLYARDADSPRPVASLTKLMTAMVLLDAGLPLDEKIEITKADRDLLRLTGSRLKYGARLTRRELIILALMSSENRAAAALGRTFPGGTREFVRAMNAKARALGMHDSRFADPAGLDAGNVASARDLARLVRAAMEYPLIRDASTRRDLAVRPYAKRGPLRYVNTNRLLRNKRWDIQVSKTGYINEAGRCLVMHTTLQGTPAVMVLLDSFGKLTPFGDANRVRKWIENGIDRKRGAPGIAGSESTAGAG
jgi:D-alanyl-D-alanine endopeptidase (penicillin-binding protein 7)